MAVCQNPFEKIQQMKNRILTRVSWNCTMFMMMMNMEQLQKYQRDIQKFTMQIMLEQSMGILPRYSREKKEL